MPDLSPAAQAVFDAVYSRCMTLDHRSATPEGHAAAIAEVALRAAADRVTDNIPNLGSGKYAQGVEDSAAYLEAIATELEADR